MNRPVQSVSFPGVPAFSRRRSRRPVGPRGRRAHPVLVALVVGLAGASGSTVAQTETSPETPAATPAVASVVAPSILARDIAPFEVVYDVGNNLITAGSARLSLARDGRDWVYSLATKPTGVFKLTGKGRIRETSVIRVVPTEDGAAPDGPVRLQPQSYSYRQDDEKRRSVDAAFDWDARTLGWTYRGESAEGELTDPVLDRLSVTLAVMNLLRQGFEELELEVFDSGEIKTMSFVNEGVETLETKMGAVETVRVRGRNADGGSRSTRTWFAPSLDYVPVRIEQRKRDELVARMNLLKLRNRVTDIELVDPDSLDELPSAGSK